MTTITNPPAFPRDHANDGHNALSAPATAPEPSWQDAPTVPGLWVVDEKLWRITKPELHEGSEDRWLGPLPGLWRNSITMKVERLEQWHIDALMYFDDARWCGPLPPEGDKR